MVIGCGGVGSRHLQALGKIDIPTKLFAIDPSQKSLDHAKKLLEQSESNKNIISINFSQKIPVEVKDVDLCIISTSSDVRLEVLKELISKIIVKNIILEKVLFQSILELDEAKKIIHEKKINCWVNCFRREEKFWNDVKDIFEKNNNIKFFYGKSDWDMCCNGIHIIDLISWLFNEKINNIEDTKLDNIIYESKRKGFIEMTGILSGKLENGGYFELESSKEDGKTEFQITSDTRKLKVNEDEEIAILQKKENQWESEEIKFHIPFQSEKTQKIVKKILDTEKCNLPTLDESIQIHKPLLNAFINHLNKISNSTHTYCPIT